MTLNANALLTGAELEAELGTSYVANSVAFDLAINEASSAVDDYLGYQVAEEVDIVEKVGGNGSPLMFLQRRPITAVDSITYDGQAVDTDSYEIDGDGSEGILYNRQGWIWTSAVLQKVTGTPIGGTDRKLYTVTYTAGYSTIPAPIKRAARLLASSYFQDVGTVPGVVSETIGKSRVQYETGAGGIPDAIAGLLAPYKAVDFA